jgi:hypothetical protein
MDKVEVNTLDRWGWECPECNDWMEEEMDPSYEESVCCDNCGTEYEPDMQG